jgi:hypothetical protein
VPPFDLQGRSTADIRGPAGFIEGRGQARFIEAIVPFSTAANETQAR